MNTDQHGWRRALGGGVAMALLAGCALTQPQADPTRFFLLAASAPATPAPAAAKAPAVQLRPVELASYIRAKPIIVRRGEHEIEFREYARWGEPLEVGIGRVLRENLLARGAAGAVVATGLRAAEIECDYILTVRVLACEGGAGGAVHFRAAWELAATGAAPKPAGGGEVRPTELRWDGKSEAALAAELSRAVGALADDIAAGLARAAAK